MGKKLEISTRRRDPSRASSAKLLLSMLTSAPVSIINVSLLSFTSTLTFREVSGCQTSYERGLNRAESAKLLRTTSIIRNCEGTSAPEVQNVGGYSRMSSMYTQT